MVSSERERLSRRLTKRQQKEALQAARRLKTEMLERRGGVGFSDSTEMIRLMREERTGNSWSALMRA